MKAILLAAGLGTRLYPLTKNWPKCMMPIKGRPLLEYWLSNLKRENINEVLINKHHHFEKVDEFIKQQQFHGWVKSVYEEKLLGTAGTIRKNVNFFDENTALIAHADNWCCCKFDEFIHYHNFMRPKGTLITMMTFDCPSPESCGILELNDRGIVIDLHEKVKNPPGSLANAAVYLVEPQVLKWIKQNKKVNDFSTEVLPVFFGKIATWKNNNIHKDVGTIDMLKKAQLDNCESPFWNISNSWQEQFSKHSIHKQIKDII